MSDNDSSQEKTEDPTSKRLEKSREEGDVPRSKELTTSALLLLGGVVLMTTGSAVTDTMMGIMRACFGASRELIYDPQKISCWDLENRLVILFHARGIGNSTPEGNIANNLYPDLAEDIETLWQHLALDKINLFGWSGAIGPGCVGRLRCAVWPAIALWHQLVVRTAAALPVLIDPREPVFLPSV